MRSKIAAVVLVLIGSALVFGLSATTASAASIGDHSDAAAALPLSLTGSVGSVAVLLGLVGLGFGLMRRGRRSRAAKRAAGTGPRTGQPASAVRPGVHDGAKSVA
ncbi:MAG TPA: hypothetical protein VHX38_00325 [Pseudonocardiaceae bacterium]|jgi:hypothetical protein|nr:hypothetical protein [Pseudonocardiaceae bacterium]